MLDFKVPAIDQSLTLNTIKGLEYLPSFISENDQIALLQAIDDMSWLDDLKRRVQHYGYKYDYKKRSVNHTMKIGPLPSWANHIAGLLKEKGLINEMPDQVIVNEYLPGQGISPHIDCEPCFEDGVVSLSLGSPCIMDFMNKGDRKNKHQLLLEPRSVLILKGDARYQWLHGIKSNRSFLFKGKRHKRERRVSLTFRKVILEKSNVRTTPANGNALSELTQVKGLTEEKKLGQALEVLKKATLSQYLKTIENLKISYNPNKTGLQSLAIVLSEYLETHSSLNKSAIKLHRYFAHTISDTSIQAGGKPLDRKIIAYLEGVARSTILFLLSIEKTD